MKLLLGLDTASHTGYCLYDLTNKKIKESGVVNLTKVRGESNGILFLKFSSWLESIFQNNTIELVIYEQAHHRGGGATEICVNLTGIVQRLCAQYNIEYTNVRTISLKKFATGYGKASKEDMIEIANKRIGRKVIDDNEADAIHIAIWGAVTILNVKEEGR
jgi:Holliday junction resolvasome RuvABC endonuclease subunit